MAAIETTSGGLVKPQLQHISDPPHSNMHSPVLARAQGVAGDHRPV